MASNEENDGEQSFLGVLEGELRFDRRGVSRTQFLVSFSGAMLISEELPILEAAIDGKKTLIFPPVRVGQASHRPTPQLRQSNVGKFVELEAAQISTPLQVATFPTQNESSGAGFNVWFGPSEDPGSAGPSLPPDTLLVEVHGPNSQNEFPIVARYFVDPFIAWLRVLTNQWWIGRSMEGVNGPLHFVNLIGADGRLVGAPTPTVRTLTASSDMRPISAAIWREAAGKGLGRKLPPAHHALRSDAQFMLASHEFRSGIILACCSLEASRDHLLALLGRTVSEMGVSRTDLLKHFSTGLEKIAGRNLHTENSELFGKLKAFWLARGEAAHGRPSRWRIGESIRSNEDVSFNEVSSALTGISDWIATVKADLGFQDEKVSHPG